MLLTDAAGAGFVLELMLALLGVAGVTVVNFGAVFKGYVSVLLELFFFKQPFWSTQPDSSLPTKSVLAENFTRCPFMVDARD